MDELTHRRPKVGDLDRLHDLEDVVATLVCLDDHPLPVGRLPRDSRVDDGQAKLTVLLNPAS